MTQYNKAVLIIEREDRTGKFEFKNDLEPRPETTRNFLIGGRGGILNEIVQKATGESDTESNSRQGYYIDAGTGSKQKTFRASLINGESSVNDPLQMGDGSSDPNDPDDVTAWDATNSHIVAQWQILDHWLSETRIDSSSVATLHYGEYSDGSEIEPGVYEPLSVAPKNWFIDRKKEDASATTVTITVEEAATFKDTTDAVQNSLR